MTEPLEFTEAERALSAALYETFDKRATFGEHARAILDYLSTMKPKGVSAWATGWALIPVNRGGSDDDEDMCPNCVTPWKCNGPHELVPA